jgi:diketogulonate reductase-like aldo/keto reductase
MMKSLNDYYILNNGVQIPCIGFGTWQMADGKEAENAVEFAIQIGYRHIDGAAAYENEKSIGRAIKASGIAREQLFITSKLMNTEHSYEKTKAAFQKTINELQTDYLDLYLIHWPNPVEYRNIWEKSNAETWKAFEELYKAGKIRAIGVSNFYTHHLDALLKTVEIKPMVNQIRLCPGDVKDKLVEVCRTQSLLLEAYSPLGGSSTSSLLKVPLILELAKKYGKVASQICVRWSLQNGFLPLPKSVTSAHITANAQVFDFELSPEDMTKLNNLKGYPDPFPHPDKTVS